jgi:MFS family permease
MVSNKFMRLTRASLFPLITILLVMLGNGFLTTFLSVRLDALGVADELIGIVQGSYYAGMLVGAALGQRLIHRLGHRRIDLLAVASLILAALLQMLWLNWVSWAALRLVQGLATGLIYLVAESWLLAAHPANQKGRALGGYAIALYGGQTLSQPILSLLNWESGQPFLISALITSSALISSAFNRPNGSTPLVELHHPLKLIRRSPLGSLTGLISGIILAALYAFAPIYAQETGLSPPFTMMLLILGGVVAQWPLGKLGDIGHRRQLLLGLAVATTLLSLTYWLIPMPPGLRLALAPLLGAASFSLYPIGLTYLSDHLTVGQLVSGAALLNLLYGIGAVAGPLCASIFIEPPQVAGLFLFTALCATLLSLCSLLRRHPAP